MSFAKGKDKIRVASQERFVQQIRVKKILGFYLLSQFQALIINLFPPPPPAPGFELMYPPPLRVARFLPLGREGSSNQQNLKIRSGPSLKRGGAPNYLCTNKQVK
jgi:hypothetical protein